MEFRGRIERVFPVQSGTSKSGSEWRKQDFVFEYFEHETDRWSDKVLLTALNDRVDAYDLHPGDEVTIGFGHSIEEYQGRCYNRVRVYKFEKTKTVMADNKPSEQPKAEKADNHTAEPAKAAQNEEKESDLPF